MFECKHWKWTKESLEYPIATIDRRRQRHWHRDISKILKISKTVAVVVVILVIAISSKGDSKEKQYNNVFEYSRVLLTKGLRNYMLPSTHQTETVRERRRERKPKDSRSGSCEISETDFNVTFVVVYINCLPIWSKIGISNLANENLCAHLYNLHLYTHTHTHRDIHMYTCDVRQRICIYISFHFICFVAYEKKNRTRQPSKQSFGPKGPTSRILAALLVFSIAGQCPLG